MESARGKVKAKRARKRKEPTGAQRPPEEEKASETEEESEAREKQYLVRTQEATEAMIAILLEERH